DQLDVVVRLVFPGHDRPEVPDPADRGQRLHDSEGDRGLAAARLDRGQVDVALHGRHPTSSGWLIDISEWLPGEHRIAGAAVEERLLAAAGGPPGRAEGFGGRLVELGIIPGAADDH